MPIKDSAKTILCYGDSNTWGNVPRSDERYPRSVRWPGVLQSLLGDDYEVVSEGLCGRTLVAMDAQKQHRTGITHLQALLESHDPLALVIIMLGTNDTKTIYNLTAEEIAQDLEETIFLIKSDKVDIEKPKILVICPPPIVTPSKEAVSKLGKDLDETLIHGIEIFKELPALYEKVALTQGCEFINAGDYVSSSGVDGYHLDAAAHKKLAEVVRGKVAEMAI